MAKEAPGALDYNSSQMLPNAPAILSQSQDFANQRFQASNDSFARQMQKQYGAIQGSGAALATLGGAADSATEVAKENFDARMKEATVRAQLHSTYMDLLWQHFKLQKKADRNGKIGAALGAVGMISSGFFGGPQKNPVAGGGMEQMMTALGGSQDVGAGGLEAVSALE